MSQLVWSPLESNPEILTQFLSHLGVSKEWEFIDILSFDSQYLDFIPRPAIAVLFLFPISIKREDLHEESCGASNLGKDLYFMKQTVFNACGTIALIHSVANNMDRLNLDSDSIIHKFIEETRSLTADERGEYLKQSKLINEAHETTALASKGVAWLEEDVCCQHHYVTLILKDSQLFEIDGLRDHPILHGSATEDSFLSDCAKICKKFIESEPDNIKFNAIALVRKVD